MPCRRSRSFTASPSECTPGNAPPHFHAVYGELEATLSIASGDVLDGRLPTRALRLVRDWAELHGVELTANWAKAQNGEPMEKIEGLDAH